MGGALFPRSENDTPRHGPGFRSGPIQNAVKPHIKPQPIPQSTTFSPPRAREIFLFSLLRAGAVLFCSPDDCYYRSIFVRNCKNCTLVLACQQFRARDCSGCTFFLFSATKPVIESSSDLRFACYTLDYFRYEILVLSTVLVYIFIITRTTVGVRDERKPIYIGHATNDYYL